MDTIIQRDAIRARLEVQVPGGLIFSSLKVPDGEMGLDLAWGRICLFFSSIPRARKPQLKLGWILLQGFNLTWRGLESSKSQNWY